jgi:hypothetical protein
MALIRRFVHKPGANASFRTEVECGWTSVGTGSQTILHLETYGSKTREIPGKVSQSIELDADGAKQLRKILDQVFPTT